MKLYFGEQDKRRGKIAVTDENFQPTMYFAKWETHLARIKKGSQTDFLIIISNLRL